MWKNNFEIGINAVPWMCLLLFIQNLSFINNICLNNVVLISAHFKKEKYEKLKSYQESYSHVANLIPQFTTFGNNTV